MMAPTDTLSAPGTASYSSDTMVVGDGTWDFTKNTFLLPNLVGLNLETLQYNGMANRFATLVQYHSLIMAHGVLAAIVFLALVPFAVLSARFHRGGAGYAIKYHAYLNVTAVGLITVVFILGFFAVGPSRNLTNPHHGIGVAVYVWILLQAIGGRLIKNIRKRSLRVMLHQWSGRSIAILGNVQIPLGLALYGSPRFTFILYAIWMAFLLLLYFVLSYKREVYRDSLILHGSRSEADQGHQALMGSPARKRHGWLAPLAAGVGVFALLRPKGKKELRPGVSRSRSRSRSRSLPRNADIIPSRRGSASYVDDDKYPDRKEPRQDGGITNKLLGVAGIIGAGALASKLLGRKDAGKHEQEGYSAVAHDSPTRPRTGRVARPSKSRHTENDPSDTTIEISRQDMPPRPVTPRPSHAGRAPQTHNAFSEYSSGYSSYVSPSRRQEPKSGGDGAVAAAAVGKGLLAGLGVGWLAKKIRDRREKRADEERIAREGERREGQRGARFTGDGYVSPTRQPSRRHNAPPRTAATDYSSVIEQRPLENSYGGPLVPPGPPTTAGRPPAAMPFQPSPSRSRPDPVSTVAMPPMPPMPLMSSMPPDPDNFLGRGDAESEGYVSAQGGRHPRSHSRQAEQVAAAGNLATQEAQSSRRRDTGHGPFTGQQPVSVKVRYSDDRDRVTLRRLTDEETAREQRRRRRSESASSLSAGESPSRRRYRRDSNARRTADEAAAERLVASTGPGPATAGALPPPSPAFAAGKRPAKDSTYYSGQPAPVTPRYANQTISSFGSPGTLSPSPGGPGPVSASAADRRRRRRQERRELDRPSGTDDFS